MQVGSAVLQAYKQTQKPEIELDNTHHPGILTLGSQALLTFLERAGLWHPVPSTKASATHLSFLHKLRGHLCKRAITLCLLQL